MPNWRRLGVSALVVCLMGIAAAQEAVEPRKVTLRVWTHKASADVWVEAVGMGPGAAVKLAELIPLGVGTDVEGCRWEPQVLDESEAGGRCRDLLRTDRDVATVRLRLSGIVSEFHKRGGGRVVVDLLLDSETVDAPRGWLADRQEEWRGRRIWFISRNEGELPPEVTLRAIRPTPATRVLIPLFVVIFVPGLMAYVLRVRAGAARADQKVNWLVWMNWILLGSWLYWISALNVTDLVSLAVRVGVAQTGAAAAAFVMALGIIVFAVPPLLAIAACMTAMAPLLSASREHFQRVLVRQVVAEASIIVPLAIFLVGLGLGEEDLRLTPVDPVLSLGVAYLVYRALAWVTWNQTYVRTEPVESGDLFERARALAAKAGVKLARLSLRRTKIPEEANAFATSGDAIVLTESLVRGLTPREVDAVLAHELGHHKEGHLAFGVGQAVFFGCLVFGWPALSWLVRTTGAPLWVETLPVVPLAIVLGQGWFSQRREYAADARAVELTGDAEGKIAALARLAQLSRIPARDGGMMGSILSHPSMEARVLKLGRRFGVGDTRALAILRNPDEAYGGEPVAGRATLEEPVAELAFTDHARTSYGEQLRWMSLLVGLGSLAAGVFLAPPPQNALQFIAGVVIGTVAAVWLTVRGEILLGTRFVSRIRDDLAKRRLPDDGAWFVGIHPGTGVRYTEGFADWDFGFLSLEEDWLRYRGEKTQFSIPRQVLGEVRPVEGRMDWLVEHRVEVRYRGGAFTFNSDFANPSRVEAEREAAWLRRWVSEQETPIPVGIAPEGPPLLPDLPGMEIGRGTMLWALGAGTLRMLVGGMAVAGLVYGESLWAAVVPLSAAAAGFAKGLPGVLWPVRRPEIKEPEESGSEFAEGVEALATEFDGARDGR